MNQRFRGLRQIYIASIDQLITIILPYLNVWFAADIYKTTNDHE